MIKCSTNIRTEIFFANEINKAGFYHNFYRLLIYMGEDEGNSFGFADLGEILQCIQCGTVKGTLLIRRMRQVVKSFTTICSMASAAPKNKGPVIS